METDKLYYFVLRKEFNLRNECIFGIKHHIILIWIFRYWWDSFWKRLPRLSFFRFILYVWKKCLDRRKSDKKIAIFLLENKKEFQQNKIEIHNHITNPVLSSIVCGYWSVKIDCMHRHLIQYRFINLTRFIQLNRSCFFFLN